MEVSPTAVCLRSHGRGYDFIFISTFNNAAAAGSRDLLSLVNIQIYVKTCKDRAGFSRERDSVNGPDVMRAACVTPAWRLPQNYVTYGAIHGKRTEKGRSKTRNLVQGVHQFM